MPCSFSVLWDRIRRDLIGFEHDAVRIINGNHHIKRVDHTGGFCHVLLIKSEHYDICNGVCLISGSVGHVHGDGECRIIIGDICNVRVNAAVQHICNRTDKGA